MKKGSTVIILLFLSAVSFGQYFIEGNVYLDDKAIADVQVAIDQEIVFTDRNGYFKITLSSPGSYEVKASFAYFSKNIHITVPTSQSIDIHLERTIYIDDIVVTALKADQSTPIAYTELEKDDIVRNNQPSDITYLMKWQPSVVVTSDAGAGIGYTSMRIRGTDPTRLNVTINGIPYNDPESQGVFWVNMPNIAASADNIQIQRGVGTSSQGAGAFGGTINISTLKVKPNRYGSIESGYGSFNTLKNAISIGTGDNKNGISMDGRLSYITSDGYIDRASSDLRSYYTSASWRQEHFLLQALVYGGQEITYQAWNGLPAQLLDSTRTYNVAGTEKEGKPYDNQVDHYNQHHAQLHYSWKPLNSLSLSASLHYTRGFGYYEEYKADEAFEDYGMTIELEGVESTNLVRRRWLDNHFYGGIFSLRYNSDNHSSFTLGGGANNYIGDHYGEVIWAEYTPKNEKGYRYYENDAEKSDANIYGKAMVNLSSRLQAYVDLQFRYIRYRFLGNASVLGEILQIDQVEHLFFFNPKIGMTYHLNPSHKAFVSIAIAHKEPNRDDYTENIIQDIVKPEKLYDLEMGYLFSQSELSVNANVYFMYYRDQLVMNGRINDVGASTRVNVDHSYRAGIELYGSYQLLSHSILSAGATMSRNKILNFDNYIDNWTTQEQVKEELSNVDIAFSPSIIWQVGFRHHFGQKPLSQGFTIDINSKFIGKQYLDNTQSNLRSIPSYHYVDLQLEYGLPLGEEANLIFTGKISNLFNSLYVTNAWTYQFIDEESDPVSYDPYTLKGDKQNRYSQIGYYPQAGIHFVMMAKLEF